MGSTDGSKCGWWIGVIIVGSYSGYIKWYQENLWDLILTWIGISDLLMVFLEFVLECFKHLNAEWKNSAFKDNRYTV